MSKENYYHSFDTLLLIDWIKATKGDLTVLRINGGDEKKDIIAWDNINDEHAETFGADSKHRAYFRLIKRLAMAKLDLIISNDKFIQNKIEILEEQIAEIVKTMQGGGTSISDTLFALSERAGYMITENTITAKKFFEMVKYYGKKDK